MDREEFYRLKKASSSRAHPLTDSAKPFIPDHACALRYQTRNNGFKQRKTKRRQTWRRQTRRYHSKKASLTREPLMNRQMCLARRKMMT